MKVIISLFALVSTSIFCFGVFGQVPETPTEAQEMFKLLIEAYKAGQWSILAGLVIMLAIFAFNKTKLGDLIDKKYIPWVSVSLGVVATVGTALIAGIPVETSVLQGLTTGTAAIGFWELIFKHVLRGKK